MAVSTKAEHVCNTRFNITNVRMPLRACEPISPQGMYWNANGSPQQETTRFDQQTVVCVCINIVTRSCDPAIRKKPALCVNLTSCVEERRQTFSKHIPYDSIYITDTSRQNQALQMGARTMVTLGEERGEFLGGDRGGLQGCRTCSVIGAVMCVFCMRNLINPAHSRCVFSLKMEDF